MTHELSKYICLSILDYGTINKLCKSCTYAYNYKNWNVQIVNGLYTMIIFHD